MNKVEFLSKTTNGTYTDLNSFNASYAFRTMVLRSIENVLDANKEFSDYIKDNDMKISRDFIALEDQVVIYKKGVELSLNFSYDLLSEFCFKKEIVYTICENVQPTECDDFWENI
jgi:hypothetical protein